MTDYSRVERLALCDLFDAVGPAAPTLCEGWDAYDLAVHLYVREADPVGPVVGRAPVAVGRGPSQSLT